MRFMMLINAIGLGRLAPDPEEAHSDILESVDPEPHQRYRSQHGSCPLWVLQLVSQSWVFIYAFIIQFWSLRFLELGW